jgi:hypothetical protein
MKHVRLPDEKEDEYQKAGWAPCIAATGILGKYQVTTCYRESSSMTGGWYYETFVWKYGPWKEDKTRDRDLVGDATSIGHIAAVQRILELGEWKEIEDDE